MPSSVPLQSWAKEELLRQNVIVPISGGKGKFGFQKRNFSALGDRHSRERDQHDRLMEDPVALL